MCCRLGVGIEPCLMGLVSGPINEARMVLWDENGPLSHRKMPHPFPDRAVFIDIAFALGLAVGVSASIHRIRKNMVDCCVSGSDPADRARLARGSKLQRERKAFRSEPEPDAASGAELGEALENRANRADDCLVRMKQDFTILFSPNEAHRHTAPQFPARGLVANAAIQSSANNVQFGFTHGAL